MKARTAWAAILPLVLSPFAYAGQESGAAQEQMEQTQPQDQATPSVGQEAPVTEHQAEALKEVDQRFGELDADGDGKISHEEAQKSPELSQYWEAEGMGENDSMDRADFAQFESRAETGADIYESERPGPGTGELPATEHQKEATEAGPVEGGSAPPEETR